MALIPTYIVKAMIRNNIQKVLAIIRCLLKSDKRSFMNVILCV